MVFINFVVTGDDFQPSVFVAQFQMPAVGIYEKGTPMRYGDFVHKQSGFSMPLDDSSDTEEAVREIERFIAANRDWILVLSTQPVEMQFSVGLTVGGADAYVPCLEMTSGFLSLLAGLRIGLEIYGYPTREDTDDEE